MVTGGIASDDLSNRSKTSATAAGDHDVACDLLPYPDRRYAWYVVAILLLAAALSLLDRQALSLLVVPIQQDLGFSDTQMGLLIGPAFIVLYVLAGFPIGYLSDHYSRRNILAAGIAVWSVATAACGLLRSYELLVIARACVGIGEACLVPAAFSLVADYFPPNQRGRAMAVVTMGISLGAAFASLGGGLLLTWADSLRGLSIPIIGTRHPWELVFLACGLPGLFVTVLLFTVREPARQGAAASADSESPLQPFFGFIRAQSGPIALIFSAYALFAYAQYAYSSWLPALLSRRQGLSPADAGLFFGIISLCVAPASVFAGGFLGDRFARRHSEGRFRIVLIFGPFLGVGVLLLTLVDHLWAIGIACAVLLIAGAMISTSVYAAIQDITPNRLRGRMLAIYGIAATIVGAGLGPAAVALVTDRIIKDPSKIHLSILIAIFPVVLIALLSAVRALPGYRVMRLGVADGVQVRNER